MPPRLAFVCFVEFWELDANAEIAQVPQRDEGNSEFSL
jgi:hypothetical protein